MSTVYLRCGHSAPCPDGYEVSMKGALVYCETCGGGVRVDGSAAIDAWAAARKKKKREKERR